jgi:three-Cys-motif partner protein
MLDLPAPQDDALYTPDVGSWSANKHHFLRRYIDAFTTAMRKKRWKGLHYIDLFASAGIERLDNGMLDWGSPLIAAQAPHRFSRLHCCELSKRSFEALSARLARFPQPQAPQILRGDANVEVDTIVKSIPAGTLSLAFLDPHGLHLNFDTVRRLSTTNVDLIIFFPDHLDALRNWEIYHENPDSNLDRVLGTSWRDEFKDAPAERRADILSDIYIRQLRTLKYTEFEYERISLPTGRFLYKLIFCSRAEVGAKIWRGVSNKKPGGQTTFDFGS